MPHVHDTAPSYSEELWEKSGDSIATDSVYTVHFYGKHKRRQTRLLKMPFPEQYSLQLPDVSDEEWAPLLDLDPNSVRDYGTALQKQNYFDGEAIPTKTYNYVLCMGQVSMHQVSEFNSPVASSTVSVSEYRVSALRRTLDQLIGHLSPVFYIEEERYKASRIDLERWLSGVVWIKNYTNKLKEPQYIFSITGQKNKLTIDNICYRPVWRSKPL